MDDPYSMENIEHWEEFQRTGADGISIEGETIFFSTRAGRIYERNHNNTATGCDAKGRVTCEQRFFSPARMPDGRYGKTIFDKFAYVRDIYEEIGDVGHRLSGAMF